MHLLVALTEVFHSDGGIPVFNRTLLRALSDFCERYGGQATVLVLNDASEDLDGRYLNRSAVRFQACRGWKRAFLFRFLRGALAGSDLVLLGHVNLLPLGVFLALLSRPYCLIAHGIEAWQRLPWLARHALLRARTVWAVSDFTRQRLSQENELQADGWRVLANALDPFFTPAVAPRAAHPTLLTVTRLEQHERAKGVEQVLEVLPELRQRFPGLRYAIVGGGSDRSWLEQRAQALGVADAVEFTGPLTRAELPARYATCHVFVLPSTQEGFGIVFLEAMAHAKPIVAARAGGVPEVVVNEETGLLVEPGDLRALQTALARLLGDADLCQRLGAAGRGRLQANFTFQRFRKRLARLLLDEVARAAYMARHRLFHRSLASSRISDGEAQS